MSKNQNQGGRPEYAPTKVDRKRVAVAAGGGMSHEQIALALGIARGTLEKHFEFELSIGAYQKRLEVLNAMHRSAVKGNVAAQKAYMAFDVRPAAPPIPAGNDKPALGKKEQAAVDATTAAAGTGWDGILPATRMQ